MIRTEIRGGFSRKIQRFLAGSIDGFDNRLARQYQVHLNRKETHAKVIGDFKHGIEAFEELVQDIGIMIVNLLSNASTLTDSVH